MTSRSPLPRAPVLGLCFLLVGVLGAGAPASAQDEPPDEPRVEFAEELEVIEVFVDVLAVDRRGGVVTDLGGRDEVEDAGSVLAAPFKLTTPLRRLVVPLWTADGN